MPRRLPTPPRAVLALGLVAVLGAAGCGADPEQEYAEGWNGVCRDVASALSAFRTDVSSAATSSPDAGDQAVAAGLRTEAVVADLAVPARKLTRALRAPLRDARALEPPAVWRTWHTTATRDLAARERTVADGVRRLQSGDAEALPLLALGGVGPASTTAPGALRDQTPDCTVQR